MTAPIIVIGAGHNGLTAAAYLAKAGREVLVLEAGDQCGGLARGDVFHPGHQALGVLHGTETFRPWIVEDLNLEGHGLTFVEAPMKITGHAENKAPIYSEGGRISGEVSNTDKADFAQFNALVERLRGPILKLLDRPPLNPRGSVLPLVGPLLSIRALGAKDMTSLMRIPPMCVADWMRNSFSNERISALLAHEGLLGNMAGPWSPWSAANLLFELGTSGRSIAGGAPAVVQALLSAAKGHGAQIRTKVSVSRIVLEGQRVKGIESADGEFIAASAVAATCDPKSLFLDLIGARHLSTRFAREIGNIRTRGVTAVLDLALSDHPLDISGSPIEALRTGADLDALERAFDPVKYDALPDTPILDIRVRAASGGKGSTASALIHFVPHRPREGWSDAARDALLNAALKQFESASPGLGSQVLATRLRTPVDLEHELGLTGGHIFHGEHAPDQMLFMRPTVACADYTTPIENLSLCGSGAHPGGGLTGVPGALAAGVLLRN